MTSSVLGFTVSSRRYDLAAQAFFYMGQHLPGTTGDARKKLQPQPPSR